MSRLPSDTKRRKRTINLGALARFSPSLTTFELGALMKLALHEVLHGHLPSSTERCRAIADLTKYEAYQMTPMLDAMIEVRDDGLFHCVIVEDEA